MTSSSWKISHLIILLLDFQAFLTYSIQFIIIYMYALNMIIESGVKSMQQNIITFEEFTFKLGLTWDIVQLKIKK